MKKSIILFMFLLIAIYGWAQKVWENPTSFCDDGHYGSIKVGKVEFSEKETVVHLNVKSVDAFQFDKGIYIETLDGNEYYAIGAKATCEDEIDIPLSEWYLPNSPYTNIALHFEPLPADVGRFHMIEGSTPFSQRIWNITEGKATDMSELFNSNWRNDQTGDWVLGLYADNAVYNCKVWKYESKDEKNVVLTDGQEKVTIAIGKEKAGKRQFTINGQNVPLSRFGSVLPAYPTADNTSFSTEYKEGEAVITGWIKDLPKDFSDKGISLVASVVNHVTWQPQYFNATSFDESGQFTMTVKLNCVQTVRFAETARKNVVFAKDLVLEPGKKYYMVHDWKNGCCLFMGENARLQNELMANPFDSPYVETRSNHNNLGAAKALKKFKDVCLEKFGENKDRLNEIVAQHPTISKRYHDYVSESNRFGAVSAIMSTWIAASNWKLPVEVEIAASKLGNIDPSMPLLLTNSLGRYISDTMTYGEQKMKKKYEDNPDLYFSLEQKGLLKLSDEDRDLLNKWKARTIEFEKNDTLGGRAWQDFYVATEKKYCSIVDFHQWRDREDVKAAYNQYAPSKLKQLMMIVDSISTANDRDFCMARALFQNILSTKQPLSVEGLTFLNDINNSFFKDVVVEQNEDMMRDIEEEEAKADARILSASIVEGLEDGKAILDKIVEPYKGKIVYLDIWGVGCGGCMMYLQQISPDIKQQLKDYDMVYLYLAAERNIGSWKYYITKFGLTSPSCVHYNLPKKQFSAVQDYIGVQGIPTFRLFDKEGNMIKLAVDHWKDMDGFKKQIDELSKK